MPLAANDLVSSRWQVQVDQAGKEVTWAARAGQRGVQNRRYPRGKREIQEHLGGSKPGTSWLREEDQDQELPGQEKRNFLAEQKQEEAEEN